MWLIHGCLTDCLVTFTCKHKMIVCFIIFPQKRRNCFWSCMGTFVCFIIFPQKRWNCFWSCMGTFDCFIIFPQKRWNCFWSYTGTFDCVLFFLRKDGIVSVVVWEHLIVCFIIFPQKRRNCFWSCTGTFDCLFYYFPSEKTELFLELYGNTLVRKQSADYVEKMSTEFIK